MLIVLYRIRWERIQEFSGGILRHQGILQHLHRTIHSTWKCPERPYWIPKNVWRAFGGCSTVPDSADEITVFLPLPKTVEFSSIQTVRSNRPLNLGSARYHNIMQDIYRKSLLNRKRTEVRYRASVHICMECSSHICKPVAENPIHSAGTSNLELLTPWFSCIHRFSVSVCFHRYFSFLTTSSILSWPTVNFRAYIRYLLNVSGAFWGGFAPIWKVLKIINLKMTKMSSGETPVNYAIWILEGEGGSLFTKLQIGYANAHHIPSPIWPIMCLVWR